MTWIALMARGMSFCWIGSPATYGRPVGHIALSMVSCQYGNGEELNIAGGL